MSKGAIVIQKFSKMNLSRLYLRKRERQNAALRTISECLPRFVRLKQSPWWLLFHHVRPLLNVTRAENKIADLESEMSLMAVEKQRLNDRLESEIAELRQSLDAAQGVRSRYERDAKEWEERFASVHQANQVLTSRNLELEQLMRAWSERSAHADVKHERETKELQTRLEQIESEKMHLAEQERSLQGCLKQREAAVSELQELLSSQQCRAREAEANAAELKTINHNLRGELAQSNQKVDKLESNCDCLERELLNLRANSDYSDKSLARRLKESQMELELEKLTTSKLREENAIHGSRTRELERQLQSERQLGMVLKREKEILETKIPEIEKTNGELLSFLEKVKKDLQHVQTIKTELEHRLSESEDANFSLNRQKKLFESMTTEQSEVITRLQSDIKDKESLASGLKEQMDTLTINLFSLQDELTVVGERLRLAVNTRTLMEAQSRDDQARIDRLAEEKRGIERQLKDALFKLSDYETKEAIYGTKGEHLAKAIEKIEKDSEEKRNGANDMRRLDRQVKELMRELECYDTDRKGLEKALIDASATIQSQQERITFLEAERELFEANRRQIELEIEDERQKIDAISRGISEIKNHTD